MSEHAAYSGAMSVTVGSHVPASVASRIAQLARENERSISGEIRVALKRHIAEAKTAGEEE
jgi:hypothetical protein